MTVATAAISILTHACSSGGTGPASERPETGTPVDDAGATGDYDATSTTDYDAYTYYVPDVVHTYAPTYSAIYTEILSPTCAWLWCHGAAGSFMDLSSQDTGYQALVNVPGSGPNCGTSGLKRVDPGHPASSLLYLKVTNPPCGIKMPLAGAVGALDSRETDQIAGWIEAGAPNN